MDLFKNINCFEVRKSNHMAKVDSGNL